MRWRRKRICCHSCAKCLKDLTKIDPLLEKPTTSKQGGGPDRRVLTGDLGAATEKLILRGQYLLSWVD